MKMRVLFAVLLLCGFAIAKAQTLQYAAIDMKPTLEIGAKTLSVVLYTAKGNMVGYINNIFCDSLASASNQLNIDRCRLNTNQVVYIDGKRMPTAKYITLGSPEASGPYSFILIKKVSKKQLKGAYIQVAIINSSQAIWEIAPKITLSYKGEKDAFYYQFPQTTIEESVPQKLTF